MTATYQTSRQQEPEVEVSEAAAAAGDKRRMVRAVNEQIRLLAEPFGATAAAETQAYFVCECPHESCFAVVRMTVTEWKAATIVAGYYVAHPQHVAAGDQAVVATDRYAVARSACPGEPAPRQAKQGNPGPLESCLTI
jgi:hypothetical protein